MTSKMVRICVAIILVLVNVAIGERQFPQFAPPPEGTLIRASSVVAVGASPPIWYASWPSKFMLTWLGNRVITLHLKCPIFTLDKANQLESMKFCFNGKGETNCNTLTSSKSSEKMNTKKDLTGAEVTLNMNVYTGGSATLLNVLQSQDISSEFFCQATNRRGTITSNLVEIVDYRNQFPTEVKRMKISAPLPLKLNSPITLKCVENAMSVPLDVTIKYAWQICGNSAATELRDCTSPINIMDKSLTAGFWPRQVLKDGSLFIPYFTEEIARRLKGDHLYCTVDLILSAFYYETLAFTAGGNEIKNLEIIHPVSETEVTLLNSDGTKSSISCNYKVGPGAVSIKWQKAPVAGGQPVDLVNNKAAGVTVEGNTIKFDGKFSASTAGKYTCVITWTPKSGGATQKKIGTYNVKLSFYPTVDKSMVPIKYVVSSMDGVVDCKFNELTVKASLGINGENVDIENAAKFKTSLQSVSAKYNKLMAPLNSEVKPFNPQPGQVIKYTAKQMTIDFSTDKHRPSTQTVNCIGTNEAGRITHSTILKVVPKPEVKPADRPSNTNCTQCSAKQEHVFRCVVSNANEFNTTKNPVILQQIWMLGKDDIVATQKLHSSGNSAQFLVVSDDLTTLTVKKIDNEKFKEFVNKEGEIRCIIKLFYPPGMKLPVEAIQSGPFKGQFYSTDSDPKLKAELSTAIRLEDIAPPVALDKANVSWAVALGLSILVVMVVIILVLVWCRKRPPGETYDVDHTEKKQGNDPETENHEKEAFPVYERPEDGPIRGSRASLDDSIQVGSDDEDEDLAEYDVDIGKFNEEGSFIGQYTNNEAGGGGHPSNSRRLPHVSTNTDV